MKILAGVIVWVITLVDVWRLFRIPQTDEEREKVLRQQRGTGL